MQDSELIRRDDTLLTVRQDGDHGWRLRLTSPDGALDFAAAPVPSPIGDGGARLCTGSHGDQVAELRLGALDGTRLRDLTDLRYWTYEVQSNSGQWPFLMLQVDLDGDGQPDDLLFFEPYYQRPAFNPALPDQGEPVPATWQHWNALAGGWWSWLGHALTGSGPEVKPLAAYLELYPDARITGDPDRLGGVRLAHGFADPAHVHDGYVDAFAMATGGRRTTFNFDPPLPAVPTPAFSQAMVQHGDQPQFLYAFTAAPQASCAQV